MYKTTGQIINYRIGENMLEINGKVLPIDKTYSINKINNLIKNNDTGDSLKNDSSKTKTTCIDEIISRMKEELKNYSTHISNKEWKEVMHSKSFLLGMLESLLILSKDYPEYNFVIFQYVDAINNL